jgi:hypothetical protein
LPIFLALLITALAQSSADAFIAQHDLAAARNPASAAFTIAFERGQHSFRIGEQIPLVLTYDYVQNRSFLQSYALRYFATPVLDRTAGTFDPQADLERALISVGPGVCGCIEGGVPAGGPRPPPVHLRMMLTGSVRLHEPGHYRVYLSDHHDRQYHSLNDTPPPIISNILEFDITRDPAWEDATLDDAIRVLDTSPDPAARAAATNAIEMIDSPRAVDELLRRRLISSLFMVHDRVRAIRGLLALIDDPEYPASFEDIRELAILQLTSDTQGPLSPAEKRAAMRTVERRRLETLRRAGTLVENLVHSFRDDLKQVGEVDSIFGRRHGSGPVVVSDALGDFVPATTAAVMMLSPQDREGVLQRDGEAFAVAAFAPMLETLALNGSAEAVRLLNVVAPDRARPIVLADLARTRPRWSADVPGVLPDPALPSLDRTFVRQLRSASNAAEFREAMARVSRFASAAIARDVQTTFAGKVLDVVCRAAPPAIAYFFRVDPAIATTLLSRIERPAPSPASCDEDWRTMALYDAAELRISPALERHLVERLLGTESGAADAASKALSWHGSSGAKAALLRALSVWRSRNDPEMERRLIVALEFGRSWRLTEADAAAIRAGCIDPDGCSVQLPALSDEAKAWIELDAATNRLVYYVGRTRVPTEGQFAARLSLLPSGTVLRWGPPSFEKLLSAWDRDLDRYLPVAAALAARQAMRVVR